MTDIGAYGDEFEDGVLQQTIFRPAWRCIYCGQVPDNLKSLGQEHVVPLSLGGTTILPRASCPQCSAVTRDFEQTCARKMFGNMRLAADMPSRNRAQRPKNLRLIGSIEGNNEASMEVPIEQYPITGCIPQFDFPGLLYPKPSTTDFLVRLRPFIMDKQNRDFPGPGDVAFTPRFSTEIVITPYAQLIAKIAHSFAVGMYGYDSHRWLLPDLITGKALNLPDYVGSVPRFEGDDAPFLLPPSGEGEMIWRPSTTLSCQEAISNDGRRYLSVYITLFFDFAPRHLVLVAESNSAIDYAASNAPGVVERPRRAVARPQ